MIIKNRLFITILLTLGVLEFFIAASFIFSIAPDPKNALWLGYSTARWAVAGISICLALMFLYLAFRIQHNGLPHKLEITLTQNISTLRSVSIFMFLVGVIVLLTPPSHLGKYAEHFERLRPLLIVITTLPFQFLIPNIFKYGVRLETIGIKYFLSILLILTLLAGFIALTGIGVNPDTYFWNVAGVPLTTLQLVFVFLVTVLVFHIINKITTSLKTPPYIIDICIAFIIYVAGVWIWAQTPMLKHFNALPPAPPVFQYFPYSDARIHDIGALSILSGYGIYYGEYTDKPLYMVLLSLLHRLAGNDYNQLSLFHLYTMGFILPALFWLGKQIHSRHLGIAIALIILIRQRNAILLANLLAGTNPRLLLTEIPTMLGLIVLCIIAFTWLKKNHSNGSHWTQSLLAGGILGAVSLIRLNPIGLLPVILPVSAIALRKISTTWIRQILVFVLGFLLVLTPWAMTGQDPNGSPYLWVKFLDVINVRYFPNSSSIEKHSPVQASNIKVTSISHANKVNPLHTTDIQNFPGFVINHSLHNVVAAFLTLPDSVSLHDQTLKYLMARPYLDEKQRLIWHGKLQVVQIPFIVINLLFLALGLGWSWNRWKWAGIFPLWIFIGYIVTLGFARNSGSRYIVPVDWVLFLYYTIGIVIALEKFTNIFEDAPKYLPSLKSNSYAKSGVPVFAITTVLLLSTLIPIAQIPRITKNLPVCENQINDPIDPQLSLLKGKVFYPYLADKTFSFAFLTCNHYIEVAIKDFDIPLQNNQEIIIGFSKTELNKPEAIFLKDSSFIRPIWHSK